MASTASLPYAYRKARQGASMAVIQREFYRSARGPSPGDEDWWGLIFDGAIGRLFVRHEWQAAGHSAIDEIEVVEFLARQRTVQPALTVCIFQLLPSCYPTASPF